MEYQLQLSNLKLKIIQEKLGKIKQVLGSTFLGRLIPVSLKYKVLLEHKT